MAETSSGWGPVFGHWAAGQLVLRRRDWPQGGDLIISALWARYGFQPRQPLIQRPGTSESGLCVEAAQQGPSPVLKRARGVFHSGQRRVKPRQPSLQTGQALVHPRASSFRHTHTEKCVPQNTSATSWSADCRAVPQRRARMRTGDTKRTKLPCLFAENRKRWSMTRQWNASA